MKTRATAGFVVAMVIGVMISAKAEEGLGVGIILGEPTGISLKKWIRHDRAIDAAAAWSFSENDSFQFHADYLIHNFEVFSSDVEKGKISLYYGLGGRVKLQNDDKGKGRNDHDDLLGIRFPLGVSFHMPKFPAEIFGEIVPIFDFIPKTDFDMNAAIGARLYFR